MSIHSSIMKQAGAPMLMGALVDFTDSPTVLYYGPNGVEAVAVVAAVGSLEISDDLDEVEGTHQREEQRQDVNLLIEQPFTPHMNGRFDIAKYSEPSFAVKEVRSVTDALVTVIVERFLVERLQRRGMG